MLFNKVHWIHIKNSISKIHRGPESYSQLFWFIKLYIKVMKYIVKAENKEPTISVLDEKKVNICLRDNVIHERDGEERGILSAAQRKLLEAVLIIKKGT